MPSSFLELGLVLFTITFLSGDFVFTAFLSFFSVLIGIPEIGVGVAF
jgi:hypothetical protein